MAKIGRVCKELMIEELVDKLKVSPSIFVTECTGLSVYDLNKLKSKLKPTKASYMVVKNSLGSLALKNANVESLLPYIEGTIGLTLGGTDPISISKALLTFSRDSGKLKVKGAVVDGKFINESEVKQLSQLPPKEVLLAMVFGGMKSPITGFVNVLHGTIRNIVYVINSIKEKKEKEGGVK